MYVRHTYVRMYVVQKPLRFLGECEDSFEDYVEFSIAATNINMAGAGSRMACRAVCEMVNDQLSMADGGCRM